MMKGGSEGGLLVIMKGFRSKLCIPVEEVIKEETAVIKESRLCEGSYRRTSY